MSQEEVKKRSEIQPESKWDVESVFIDDEAWHKASQEFQIKVETFEQQVKGKIAQSAAELTDALAFRDQLSVDLGKIYVYARLKMDEDATNSFYQSLFEKAEKLRISFNKHLSFFEPELLAVETKQLQVFMNEDERLQGYRTYFDVLQMKKEHILTEEGEQLLSRLQEPFGVATNAFTLFSNADLKFPAITGENGESLSVTQGRFVTLLSNPNRKIRKQAYESVYNTYKQFSNTLAALLSGEVKGKSFTASMRGFARAREAALKTNQIPERVYDQLVETVNEHLPLLHRYMRLRKKLLGLEQLEMYDLYVPIIKDTDLPFRYDEAKETLIEAVKPLGEEYVSIVKKGFEEGWVDIYENEGKRSGAYSSGSYATKPFILMNWQDTHDSLSTLAHEFGHSVHSYYTRKYQPSVYGYYTIFLAEVASTLNEALLHDYLIKRESDKNKKLYLLNQYLEGIRTTVFRQTMFAEFEHFLYKQYESGGTLTQETISNEYHKLNKKYYGEDVHSDELISYEWARIPHFYMNYYVYQYATGYSAAQALSKQVLSGEDSAADRFITFLKSGISDKPIELLRKAGVDMETKQPVEDTMTVFEETLNQMEALLGEE
ncbi:oligoendopeptidase F [Alkalihalobacillus xiaoxiensis]|uniref:Oligopeptidase F n=1 Tax=Shouchella xiaoxiensis TaxID=766895 RepID=A0ABS2SXW2_9BACI|nr:oligoendopeptidase F [Shouchella xiaoxiensis]MBM7840368.1 oligoendopeptidase F [Shouchella xiaoxiensis]